MSGETAYTLLMVVFAFALVVVGYATWYITRREKR